MKGFIKNHGKVTLMGMVSVAFTALGISFLVAEGKVFSGLMAFAIAIIWATLTVNTYRTENE
jgi:hypothetical protein